MSDEPNLDPHGEYGAWEARQYSEPECIDCPDCNGMGDKGWPPRMCPRCEGMGNVREMGAR